MPPRKKQKKKSNEGATDFRYPEIIRTNNPPAGITPTYEVCEHRARTYAYNPNLDPQLIWAGKAEHTSFDVGVVSLHIHEWVSTSAILCTVCRPELLQLELFVETLLSTDRGIEFYKHEVGWANCSILGDSLLIINSLLFKEDIMVKVC